MTKTDIENLIFDLSDQALTFISDKLQHLGPNFDHISFRAEVSQSIDHVVREAIFTGADVGIEEIHVEDDEITRAFMMAG